jgi:hypothetical protein
MYIQQAHLALEHIFCMMVEQHYFGSVEEGAIMNDAALRQGI